ncbi:hypothetical protein [Radiobacillus sp. PE A8.2]|uniref:hypothetical protein n=1 Tax=Radiobacillus sp. PE A8.2 TaxID=3380349 RepID=UPI00388F2BC0
MILQYLIVPLIVVLVVYMIMSVKYKDIEKIDKGFILNYHKLSYRRRLIRALWGIPFSLLLYLALFWLADLTTEEYRNLGIVFLFLLLINIAYEYGKWKKHVK